MVNSEMKAGLVVLGSVFIWAH